MTKARAHRLNRVALRVLGAIGLSIALSGCIVEPLYGPHYYHPYRYGYGGGY